MIFSNPWAMPSKWTFTVPCIMALIRKYAHDGKGWADPFAGKSQFAEFRNDLDPNKEQPFCLDAAEFLKQLAGPLEGVIFDPPYSLTQVSKSYEEIGVEGWGKGNPTGGFPLVKDEIRRVVRPGGHVLSFGWNSVGMGHGRWFKKIELMVVCHGGNRNDTLCLVERRMEHQEPPPVGWEEAGE
jgi:hypothetical protein